MTTFAQQQLQFADEISFNDQSATSMSKAIPTLSIDAGLVSGRASDRSMQTRLWHTRPGYRMPRSNGQLKFEVLSAGAQVDTSSGALSATALHTLLSNGLGGSDLTGVGGVAGAAASTTAFAAATGTRPRGSLSRIGQAGDGKGEGQATVWGNPNTNLLVAAVGAPGATDKLRACQVAYLKETHAASQRFLLYHANDSAMQYLFTGCVLESWSIKYVSGDVAIETYVYRYAYWREVSGLSELSLEQCDSAIAAGGSFMLQTVGTATRQTDNTTKAAEMDVALNLGLVAQIGEVPGLPLCNVLGFVRTRTGENAGTLRLLYPWEDATQSTAGGADYEKDGSSTVLKHFLFTLSAGGGAAENEGRHNVGYLPSLYPIGDKPTFKEWNGLPYQERMYALQEGPDTTNNLTRSAFRFGRS